MNVLPTYKKYTHFKIKGQYAKVQNFTHKRNDNMKIYISDKFTAACDSDNILGRIGETNSRTIEVEQPEVEGADCYRLRFCYDDDVIYDVPLIDRKLKVSASLLRYAGTVSCVWIASKVVGEGYQLVAKSNSVTLEIQESTDGSEAIPAPEIQSDLLDKCQSYSVSASKYAEQSESYATLSNEDAKRSKESASNAKTYANSAENFCGQAETYANSASTSADSANESAETAAEQAQISTDKANIAITQASLAAGKADNAAVYSENAQQSAAAAESAKIAAEEKAAEITQNSTQIQQNKNDIAELQDNSVYISDAGYLYGRDSIYTIGVTAIAASAYKGASMLKTLAIPDSITSIGSVAFANCKNLESVILPDSITSIEWNLFTNCTSLVSIVIPSSITKIGSTAFLNCKSLSDITLGNDFNATGADFSSCPLSAEMMESMFNSLKDLTNDSAKTLTLGSKNLAKLTDTQKQSATNKNWNLA